MAIVINSQWDAQQFYKEKEQARQHINSAWDAQQFYETYGGNGYAGNWGSQEWAKKRASLGTTYTYNAALDKWVAQSFLSFNTDSLKLNLNTSKGGFSGGSGLGFSGGSGGAISQAGAVNSDKDAATDSKTGAEKEYIDVEFNTLTGDVELIPTKNNMKLKAGQTVEFRGIGKYLSGMYFISEIKRKIDKDNGFSMTATLYKNGFGDTLKSTVPPAISPAQDNRAEQVDTSSNTVNNKFKVGDKVKIVGDDAVYSNASDGVKVPYWVKQQVLTIDAISEDGARVRLNPIWSWTYTKFIKQA